MKEQPDRSEFDLAQFVCKDAAQAVERARSALCGWGALELEERVRMVGRLRVVVAERMDGFARAASFEGHSEEEAFTSEVLPLLDALRFLELETVGILAPREPGGRGLPGWMRGVSGVVRRIAHGVVAVISPANYRLFLGAVQAAQGLVAGNCVVWKPAPGCLRAALEFGRAVCDAGFPAGVLQILEDEGAAGAELCGCDVNKVVFTGSFETGVRVLNSISGRAIPAVMELSGCDAVLVREDADLERAVDAICFGLRLNRSRSCIAPRRVFVHQRVFERFESALVERLEPFVEHWRGVEVAGALGRLLRSVAEGGVSSKYVGETLPDIVLGGVDSRGGYDFPMVLSSPLGVAPALVEDVALPIVNLVPVESDERALELLLECPYALGFSIFTNDAAVADRLGALSGAGSVVVNDLIAPTADPRLPFGGGRRSGFGVTRGAEGLLEMTRVQTLQFQGAAKPRHHGELPGMALLLALGRCLHARGVWARMRGFVELVRLSFLGKPK